jgi:hypothetical protein
MAPADEFAQDIGLVSPAEVAEGRWRAGLPITQGIAGRDEAAPASIINKLPACQLLDVAEQFADDCRDFLLFLCHCCTSPFDDSGRGAFGKSRGRWARAPDLLPENWSRWYESL